VILLVISGDARLDNQKFKATFRAKPSMLQFDDVEAATGHPVGGVTPLGLLQPLRVFCDESLRAYDDVLPAAGAMHAAVRLSPARLAELSGATWVDVTRRFEADTAGGAGATPAATA